MRYLTLETSICPFVLMETDEGRLQAAWMNDQIASELADWKHDSSMQPELVDQLRQYFVGVPVDFSNVPLPLGADFNQRCWAACRNIPHGETRSYTELAIMAGGKLGSARAAGQAMRNNPIPVIIPCHRVIGSNGDLHGYGGSCDAKGEELTIKRGLLELEGVLSEAALA